jgi:hypothetical protein
LPHQELAVSTVSMEEDIQQQKEAEAYNYFFEDYDIFD